VIDSIREFAHRYAREERLVTTLLALGTTSEELQEIGSIIEQVRMLTDGSGILPSQWFQLTEEIALDIIRRNRPVQALNQLGVTTGREPMLSRKGAGE